MPQHVPAWQKILVDPAREEHGRPTHGELRLHPLVGQQVDPLNAKQGAQARIVVGPVAALRHPDRLAAAALVHLGVQLGEQVFHIFGPPQRRILVDVDGIDGLKPSRREETVEIVHGRAFAHLADGSRQDVALRIGPLGGTRKCLDEPRVIGRFVASTGGQRIMRAQRLVEHLPPLDPTAVVGDRAFHVVFKLRFVPRGIGHASQRAVVAIRLVRLDLRQSVRRRRRRPVARGKRQQAEDAQPPCNGRSI